MAVYESFTTGGSNSFYVYDGLWQCQTFTVGATAANEAFTLDTINLWVQRQGSPGTLTVELYAVDVNDQPTGSALSSGTINANTFDLYGATEQAVSMSTSYELQPSTTYAIVIHITGGSTSVCVLWNYAGAGGYSGGNIVESQDSGSSWTDYTDIDFLFEVNGTAVSVTIAGQADGVADVSGTLNGIGKLSGTIDDTTSIESSLKGHGELIGVIDNISSLEGILKGQGDLLGTSDSITEILGDLKGIGKLITTTDSIADVGGTLGGIGDLSGTIITYSELSGTVQSPTQTLYIIGQSDGESSLDAIVKGIGKLIGVVNGVSELSLITVHEFELLEGDSSITLELTENSTIELTITENSLI
jgi:hypothetical protein